jgi:xanthine dehydrogenase accessory factor
VSMDIQIYKKIIEELEKRNPVAVATIVGKEGSGPRDLGATMIITVDGKKYGTIGGGHVEKIIIGEALKALQEGTPRRIKLALRRENIPKDAIPTNQLCGGVIEVFINVLKPAPRLVITGGGNVGKPIADIANILGWRTIIIDSDPKLASRQRYPYAEKVLVGKPSELIASNATSPYDIAIIAYGEVEEDYQSLRNLILSGFRGHIWALCSRTRATWMLKRLVEEENIDLDKYIDRLHMPAGLDINSDSHEEIAISIIAEIICVLKNCKLPVRSMDISSKWWNTYKLQLKKTEKK